MAVASAAYAGYYLGHTKKMQPVSPLSRFSFHRGRTSRDLQLVGYDSNFVDARLEV